MGDEKSGRYKIQKKKPLGQRMPDASAKGEEDTITTGESVGQRAERGASGKQEERRSTTSTAGGKGINVARLVESRCLTGQEKNRSAGLEASKTENF